MNTYLVEYWTPRGIALTRRFEGTSFVVENDAVVFKTAQANGWFPMPTASVPLSLHPIVTKVESEDERPERFTMHTGDGVRIVETVAGPVREVHTRGL